MTYEEFVGSVRARAGFERLHEAAHIAHTVLGVFRLTLDTAESRAVADELAAPLAQVLRRVVPDRQDMTAEALYGEVAMRAHIDLGIAVEQTKVVLSVLAQSLSSDRLRRLRKDLPRDLASLLTPPEYMSPADRLPMLIHEPRRTLAEGQPGSMHPLSSARPERAHSQSVARSDQPHEDTKLSSSKGLTQERFGESLAGGRPTSKRTIGGA